jgi:hypothetical protein
MTAAGRADALRWLFFLSGHVSPPAPDLAFNRIAVKLIGGQGDEAVIAREKALPEVVRVLEGLDDDSTLVESAYGRCSTWSRKLATSVGPA